MAIVYFDRPKSRVNPNREANALLLAQVQHLREAEKSLPSKYQSGIFSQTIRTEGDVARYVQSVTEAIHQAHADAAEGVRPKKRIERVIEIAAAAETPVKKRTTRKRTMAKKAGQKRSSRNK